MSCGLQRQRPGDADALALAAGELVRVAVRGAPGARPTTSSRSRHARSPLSRAAETVDLERLADDLAHGHARIERREGVLEDDLHVAGASARSSCRGRAARFVPSKRTSPDGRLGTAGEAAARRSSCRSPTRPPGRGSRPGRIVKSTPSTARTKPFARRDPLRHLELLPEALLLHRGALVRVPPAVDKQSTRWLRVTLTAAACSPSQAAKRCGQRGWNGTPDGNRLGSGTVPGSPRGRFSRSIERDGTQRPCV